ncbi:hypothetical protein MPSEU_000573400 [Mayamaea pseudoterrestris]|nr:hypothetical protein MPSEU_000573400 [Mayamaea pseudoterrestris]
MADESKKTGEAGEGPVELGENELDKIDVENGDNNQQDESAAAAQSTPNPRTRPTRIRQGSALRRDDERRNRMERLHLKRIIETRIMRKRYSSRRLSSSLHSVTDVEAADSSFVMEIQTEAEMAEQTTHNSEVIMRLEKILGNLRPPGHPLEVRMNQFCYSVAVPERTNEISTVFNRSPVYYAMALIKKLLKGAPLATPAAEKHVLQNINLVLKPGKSYLVLGHPGCGKTTLLRVISARLRRQRGDKIKGSVLYNGSALQKHNYHIENLTAFIDQLDKHAPRLTVEETFAFANLCKRSNEILNESLDDSLNNSKDASNDEQQQHQRYSEKYHMLVNLILIGLGLESVKDTFVGDADVRGISGGQRRRVTVGEMMGSLASILGGDEISVGLDATSTYEMIQVLAYFSTFRKFTRVVSLLQASPETVSLFDEIILLSQGRVIYAGPVKQVEDYFADVGFVCPRFVDIADFLQMVSSEDDGIEFERAHGDGNPQTRPSISELAEIFRYSELGMLIQEELQIPTKLSWDEDEEQIPIQAQRKYANNFFVSTHLLLRRFITLWTRDKRVIIAGLAKNVIMGVSVGGTYLSTTDQISILGALFQAVLFIVLGAMQSASALISDRVIYYKHSDANFYSAWPFVFGRSLSQVPQTMIDTVLFATILYFMIGLADRESAANFFTYLALLFVFAVLMIQQLAVFASFASAGTLSAYSACVVLLLVLFGGFIIPPATIPGYFKWLYWWNPFAWVYRALVVNEFRCGRWENPNQILENGGFIGPDGNPFSNRWIGWAFLYMILYSLLCCTLTALGLTLIRNEGGAAPSETGRARCRIDAADQAAIQIPFKPVTLSFKNVSYEVDASMSNSTLTLLQEVNGIFRPGRMCCLMGSSGAGKTTLLDVIALRKRSGTVKGEIFLNGWPQDPISFRRCSGYVEQFDVQTPELTVRECIVFSAKLRLDPEIVKSDLEVDDFVDQIMDAVELAPLAGVLVGTDSFGLSFEQKKRLSIAVELAASPSIIFLDEPTSGLDSRSAMIIVRALRRIADGGRTICATIHQPSASVFEMFDDLLLLKKGGRVVYNGELGDDNCSTLVTYLESKGAAPIELGDNPADWMLRVLDSGKGGDMADLFASSSQLETLLSEIDRIHNNPDPELKLQYRSEYPTTARRRRILISRRLNLIYWRSPTYNLARLMISLVIAFVLGSSFVTSRRTAVYTEPEIRARLSVIFLSFIITGIMAIMSVLPVMSKIRDMFYRHHDAGMYDSGALGLALGVAEKFYIVGSCFLFCLCFLGVAGFLNLRESAFQSVGRSIGFWGFFTFNFAIYSYFGQLFVCLVKPQATAIILSSVFIGLNNFFSGLVVLPQYLRGTFYAFPYFITPGHYVYNGMVTSLFANSTETVVANSGSGFYEYLLDEGHCTGNETMNLPCNSTVSDYVIYFYGGYYGQSGHVANAVALGAFLVAARVLTWLALKYIRFS